MEFNTVDIVDKRRFNGVSVRLKFQFLRASEIKANLFTLIRSFYSQIKFRLLQIGYAFNHKYPFISFLQSAVNIFEFQISRNYISLSRKRENSLPPFSIVHSPYHRPVIAFLPIKLINNASSCIVTLSKSLNVPSMPLVRLLIMVINICSLTSMYSSVKRCLLNHLFCFNSNFYRRCIATLMQSAKTVYRDVIISL